jgi:adenosylcobyric acid synthase
VIVHGRVYGNFSAQEYYRHKPRLVQKVMESYRRLSGAYELVILEGAGSAVELNLKKNDLVNFHMARKAGAAVLLVADIDRGGVFAATIGSFHLLTPAERRLLSGFIINKFRGDAALFTSGVEIIQRRTRRPVLGVVPYAADLVLPEEDSVALGRRRGASWDTADGLKIGVVRLPHISNYTDFDPLEQEAGVSLRYLKAGDSLTEVDLLILPGTKNTISDLLHLKESGLFRQIQAYAQAAGRVVGICGGYQILGQEVRDPLGVEGPPRTEAGLDLLPVVTTMAGAKTTTQTQAQAPEQSTAGCLIEAYEIHMGVTEPQGPGRPAFHIISRNGRPQQDADGWVSADGRIWGTYFHGLFDNDDFRRAFLEEMRQDRPTAGGAPALSFRDFQEAQLDRLAELLRRHLDLERIRALIVSSEQ